jgi:hypothetical protein
MALLLKQILEQLGALKNHSHDSVALVVVLSMFLSFSLVVVSTMGNGTRPLEPMNSRSGQPSVPTNPL